jgi:hypothetical protein
MEIEQLTCEEFSYFLAHGEDDQLNVFTFDVHDNEGITLDLIGSWLGNEASYLHAA